jgi:hypothetical protein
VLLFAVDDKANLLIASTKREIDPRPGWTVIALVPPQTAVA